MSGKVRRQEKKGTSGHTDKPESPNVEMRRPSSTAIRNHRPSTTADGPKLKDEDSQRQQRKENTPRNHTQTPEADAKEDATRIAGSTLAHHPHQTTKHSPPSPPLCLHLSSRYTCLPALVSTPPPSLPPRSKIPRIFLNKIQPCLPHLHWDLVFCWSVYSNLAGCVNHSLFHRCILPKRFPCTPTSSLGTSRPLQSEKCAASLRSCCKISSYHCLTTDGST